MLNAAQQQGFEALRQGMAPSANQQAELHSLWEKAPGYVPAHRGGWGEFSAAPAADAADGFRSGPLALGAAQDAGEAAQRRAFLKWTQGEAMTAREKARVDGLWNTDPHRASEYWAAGEFLDTEVPSASSLDGPRLHDTIEGADGYFLDRGLMEELENSGAKYTPENVMCIVKTPDGMLQWLETGNESSGWMHIERHATDFQRRGVDDPYSFLCEVLQTQPTERGVRPTGPYAIYEMDGKEYTLAYGKNGYIVSFYPKC